jgi:2-isopropylmalate synthase
MNRDHLIYDWNTVGPDLPQIQGPVELNDETLRDGLQSPSVRDPSLDEKIRFIHLMDRLGIYTADIGLPGAGPRAVESVDTLMREIVTAKLKLKPNCAGRTVIQDIKPIAQLSQKHGVPIEAYLFLGSSPIRQYVEDWDLNRLLQISGEAIAFAAAEGLPVSFVTEDTTRSDPETLRPLFLHAIEKGARRLCLCDTVGHSSPSGVANLARFVQGVTKESGVDIELDSVADAVDAILRVGRHGVAIAHLENRLQKGRPDASRLPLRSGGEQEEVVVRLVRMLLGHQFERVEQVADELARGLAEGGRQLFVVCGVRR